MIIFKVRNSNPDTETEVPLFHMLYGNSFEIPYSHLDVRGMLAYRGGISKNEPVFYNDTEENSVFDRPLNLYMEFSRVSEKIFDDFVNIIVKASDRGRIIAIHNTYDELMFPIEYEKLYGDFEHIPARRYEGYILDYRFKYNRDILSKYERGEQITQPFTGSSLPSWLSYTTQMDLKNPAWERSIDLSVTFVSGKMVVAYDK